MARYLTLQNLSDTSIVNGDLIGQIGFAASNDSDGGDAIAICSSISVKAEGTFDGSNNPGAIVFATAPNNGPTDRLKVTNEGHFVPIADTSYDLGVSGSLHFRDVCLSGIVFDDGTYQTTAATAGGGGTPGGSVNQIQINDGAGGFTAATNSDRFVYDDSTNTFDLGRQSADNVAGGQFTNYWFANNFCVGGGNFSATMDSDANNNTAVGIDALGALTFGDDNVAIGYQAGDALTASDDNTIIGSQAGSAFGNNINDNRNVVIGYQAANAATDIASNVIIGYQAGLSAAGPDGSVIIGAQAGYDSDADYNVLIGYQCGYKADGNYNIYIGKPQSSAGGAPNVTGSGNLILGRNFDPSNNAIHGLPNGYSSTASEQFAIANSLVGDFSTQRIGVGEAAINALDATLHVIPQNSSDVVLKVEGAASQSANLQEWENSSNVTLAHVDATGGISGTSVTINNYALPLADGSANQVLTTDGAGNVTFEDAGGGGTPGGNSTEFQYNNGGSFNGTTGVVYEATNGTGILLKVHGTGSPKDNLFSVEYTGIDAETTVSIYRNNASDTANLFQVRTEASGDLFTVSPTGKVYERSSHGNVEHSGSASSFTFDLDESNIFTATLSSTSSTVSIANGDVGQRFILRLTNGVANAKVGTWFSNINWPGGNPASGSLVNGETNLFGFLTYSGNGGTLYHDGFAIATGVT